jgi:hypothetical protein
MSPPQARTWSTCGNCPPCWIASLDSGKPVTAIEHHQAVMVHADWMISLGPGAGHDGGASCSKAPALVAARATLTGEHLAAFGADADSGHRGAINLLA